MTSHNETTLRGRTIISTTHQRIMKIFSKQVTSTISDPLTLASMTFENQNTAAVNLIFISRYTCVFAFVSYGNIS